MQWDRYNTWSNNAESQDIGIKKVYSKKMFMEKMYRKNTNSKKMFWKKMHGKKIFQKKMSERKCTARRFTERRCTERKCTARTKVSRCSQAELSMEIARLIKNRSVTTTITKSKLSKMRRIIGLDTRRSILRHRNRTAAWYKRTNWRPWTANCVRWC